jgi:ComF family protein
MAWSPSVVDRGELLVGLASLLAPRRCAACPAALPPAPRPRPPGRAFAGLLCGPCRRAITPIGPACPACGAPRPLHADPAPRCDRCQDRPKGAIRATTALLRYRGVVRRMLHRMKYAGRAEVGRPLGEALGLRVLAARGAPPPDLLVVPVPLHLLRRLGRGFNQAERIAEGVAAALERPLVPALARRRRTRALHGVRRDERDGIVTGAFRCVAPVAGRPVLLVDDIRTSGATLRAAAEALGAAGARRVEAAVVAR